MDEVPLYWWRGNQEGVENCARKYEAAARQVRRMIARDRNHPSVVFWSVSNETQEQYPEVAEGNRKLVALARELDPSRPCVHVSDHWRDHPNFRADDVICLNAYPSLGGLERQGLDYDFAEAARTWRHGMEAMHQQYPGKPILVTEFGCCSLEGSLGNPYGEDVHARVLEAEFAAMDADYVCGATIWCWADHAWPAESFNNGLAISPYGVVTRERHKKQSYWAARRMFRAKQGLAAG